jgi:ribose transport system ATP-binding protein
VVRGLRLPVVLHRPVGWWCLIGAPPVARATRLSKSFDGRQVLREVDLEVIPGEVHALLGQNGSGKSTLIKILSGYHSPDWPSDTPGPRLEVRGEPVDLPLSAPEAGRLGLAFVHQELPIALEASVLENLLIGRFETGFPARIRWGRERARVSEALRGFGLDVRPDQLVGDLPGVERAMLAILRALQGLPEDRPGLLVLDEPTAYLPLDGLERVFESIRRVAAAGHGVLVVTHRLGEVFAISDRVSVLRDGAKVKLAATRELSEQALIEAILGFQMGELYPEPVEGEGEVVLAVRGLRGDRLEPLDLELRAGEIVGATGLLGAGYEELPYLLFGARRARSGVIRVGGESHEQRSLSPRVAMELGMALLPADRRGAGAVLDASVRENVTLPTLRRYFRGGLLRSGEERRHVLDVLRRFDVTPPEPDRRLGTLSGGNQQKAHLAKWFELEPRVLVLHEPTQGVDVGARQAIFRLIRDAADSGAAVIIASAEYADLAHLCRRALVFRDGRMVAELDGEALTEERIIEQSLRVEPGAETVVAPASLEAAGASR